MKLQVVKFHAMRWLSMYCVNFLKRVYLKNVIKKYFITILKKQPTFYSPRNVFIKNMLHQGIHH